MKHFFTTYASERELEEAMNKQEALGWNLESWQAFVIAPWADDPTPRVWYAVHFVAPAGRLVASKEVNQ